MKKKIMRLIAVFFSLTFLLTGIQYNGSFLETAQAATGLNMNGQTIEGYPYSDSHFPVYDSTGSGKRQIGTCYGNHIFFKMLNSAAPPKLYSQILRLIENQDAE